MTTETDDAQTISYSIRRACRISGLGKSKIYEAMSRGDLEFLKVGRRTLIEDAALRQFLAGHRVVKRRAAR